MKAGVLKETWPGETRVATVPGSVPALLKAGVELTVESGAGQAAGYPDALYAEKGARLATREAVLAEARLLLSVRSFAGGHDAQAVGRLGREHVVVGLLDPLQKPAGLAPLAKSGATCFALELLPRITRAQAMDALSSTATIVGYKAVLLAADALPRMMPMLMTAAGTVSPARVFVIGAGVAGLQAIATARRLGAVVDAYDVRPAVKDQIQSLGARFVELPLETAASEDKGGYAKAQDEAFYRRQRELLARVVADSDVVVCTAAVPGRKAPVLVTQEMVEAMRPGSVIVDLAAEQGGNCEATAPGETVLRHAVRIMGPLNLAATLPYHASQLYAKNVATFVVNLLKQGEPQLDADDEIVRETMLAREGEITSPRVRELLGLPPQPAPAAAPVA
ncbi:MAG: Re/Si-specific NAD(P)(+) transhydrogenase subunit alpha [Betaproteobacteria bacterium]